MSSTVRSKKRRHPAGRARTAALTTSILAMLGLIGGFAARAVVSGSSAGGSTANATAVAPASQTDDASSDDPTSGTFAPAVAATQQGFSNPVTTTHSS